MRIQVAYMGRSYVSAGQLPAFLDLPESAGLNEALQQLAARLPEPLPPSCLISVSGQHVGTWSDHPDRPLSDGDELLLIAPVAGG